jgi:hypothetical protein
MTLHHAVVALALAIACAALPAAARWPDDPAQNLAISARPEFQYDTRVLPAPGNGWFIAWVDRRNGGRDIYLQRLDAAGNAMWPAGGILAATRSAAANQGVDVDVDHEDHIILAFHDVRAGINQVIASRISPEGQPLWGADGIQLTDNVDEEFVLLPRIAITDDDEIVIGWSHNEINDTADTKILMQRLAPDGSPIWDELLTLAPDMHAGFWLCDLKPSDNGAVIASWVYELNYESPRYIWAQKYDRDGNPLWIGDDDEGGGREVPHIVIFDAGSIQHGCFPPLVGDGEGGAVFSWYRTYVGPLQVFAQHVRSDGVEMFPHNGAAVSIDLRERRQPRACFNPDTRETFVFWVEQIYGESILAVYGQKLDAHGDRQWGDGGIEIVPGTFTQHHDICPLVVGDGAMVCWVDEPEWEHCYLNAARLDGGGAFVWEPSVIIASTFYADKDDLAASMNEFGDIALAWKDGRNADDGGDCDDGDVGDDREQARGAGVGGASGSAAPAFFGDVYAQNITIDGALGMRAGDVDGDGIVNTADLLLLLADWGCADAYCPGDLNEDGTTNTADLLTLLADWG